MSMVAGDQHSNPMGQSRLLSLPAELRLMIWEAVVDIPIHASKVYNAQSKTAIHLRDTGETLWGIDGNCPRHVEIPKWEELNHPKRWLMTNKQIYGEGKEVVDKGFCVQVCNAVDLLALVASRAFANHSRLCNIRCISMCRSIEVVYSNPCEFRFETAFGLWHNTIPASSAPRKPNEFVKLGRNMQKAFPQLKEIRVQLFLICRYLSQKQWEDAFMSQMPSPPNKLKYDGAQIDIDNVAKELVYLKFPFKLLKDTNFKVHINIQGGRVEHGFNWNANDMRSLCWSRVWEAEKDTVPVEALIKAIQKELQRAAELAEPAA